MSTSIPPVPGVSPRGQVRSVSLHPRHSFSKPVQARVLLLAGLGVEGDAHCGASVRHRYRVKQDPTQPNLCQVHLVHEELFAQLQRQGFSITPGELGENITTSGIDLLSLPVDTHLALGESAVVRLTGLRTPCVQLDRFQRGLMAAMKGTDCEGELRPQCGVMAVVLVTGAVSPGDAICVVLPPLPHRKMQCV